jgi:hypothetical protein
MVENPQNGMFLILIQRLMFCPYLNSYIERNKNHQKQMDYCAYLRENSSRTFPKAFVGIVDPSVDLQNLHNCYVHVAL